MTTLPFKPVSVAAMMLAMAALPAGAQEQDHTAHHPEEAATATTPVAPETPTPAKTGKPGMMMQGGMMMGMKEGGKCAMMMKGLGPDMLYGVPAGEELTPEKVRDLLEKQLQHHGNAHLKIGKIEARGDATIMAEIVTTEGALVQRLAFNRFPGLVRQIP